MSEEIDIYEHFVITNSLLDVLDASLAARAQGERARHARDVEQEVRQHLLAFWR